MIMLLCHMLCMWLIMYLFIKEKFLLQLILMDVLEFHDFMLKFCVILLFLLWKRIYIFHEQKKVDSLQKLAPKVVIVD